MRLSLDLVSYWLIQIRAKNNHIFVTLIISKVAHSDSMKAFRKVLIFSFVTIFALLYILAWMCVACLHSVTPHELMVERLRRIADMVEERFEESGHDDIG